MKVIFLILSLLVVLSGCSGLSPDECKSADWTKYGENDAMGGRSPRYSHWDNICGEYGIAPDHSGYTKGYDEGLKKYCTFQNGYEVGHSGKSLPKICPLETQETFTKGFIEGERSYTQKEILNRQTMILEQNSYSNMSCQINSDCKIIDSCKNNKCERSLKYCSYQSDCTISGSCVQDKCRF